MSRTDRSSSAMGTRMETRMGTGVETRTEARTKGPSATNARLLRGTLLRGAVLRGALGVSAFAGVGVVVAACGSRGPLDADGPLDAATAADVANVEVATDATPAEPDAAPVVDAGREGGSILGCGTCLVGQCSQGILACVQDPACQKTFQCVVTKCLAGGGSPNPACLFTCASGDTKGALKIFQIFQCVTSTCGTDCNPVLSGLLGGLGGLGGGGGGGGGGGPKKVAEPLPPFAQAVSLHWPELCAPPEPTLRSIAATPTPAP